MTGWQAALLLAAAAGGAAWLFLLEVRPPRVVIPSLLLWRRVLDERRELTLWERIRRAVSLVVTVLVALAIALAIVRPASLSGSASASRGRLLIVLDSSWSMLARTAHGETRWARAIAEARRLAAASAGDEIAVATTADGLVEGPTADLSLIESGLDRVSPNGGDIGAWPRVAGATRVHFITDGALARPLDSGVIVHSVFEAAPNVGITAFNVRSPIAGVDDADAPVGSRNRDRAGDAYLEIANFSDASQQTRLVITRGESTIFDRELEVGAKEALRQVVPLPAGGDPLLRARIEAPQDALPVDDEAYAWMARTQPLSVAVVGQQTAWLASLFTEDPDVRAAFVTPETYRPAPADVTIFDRWIPEPLPSGPTLVIAGGAGAPLSEEHPVWRERSDHPVLRGVDPLTFTIDRAHQAPVKDLEPLARSERGTPLVSIGQTGGHRVVAIAFGPGESNLSRAPGFPVLVGNALEWLARPGLPVVQRTGSVEFDESVTSVTGPDGRRVPLERVEHSVLGVLREPGIYVAEGGGARQTVAVNVGNPQLSNTQATTLTADDSSPVAAGRSPRPWWAYCALAAVALIVLEWWTWQRRLTV